MRSTQCINKNKNSDNQKSKGKCWAIFKALWRTASWRTAIYSNRRIHKHAFKNHRDLPAPWCIQGITKQFGAQNWLSKMCFRDCWWQTTDITNYFCETLPKGPRQHLQLWSGWLHHNGSKGNNRLPHSWSMEAIAANHVQENLVVLFAIEQKQRIGSHQSTEFQSLIFCEMWGHTLWKIWLFPSWLYWCDRENTGDMQRAWRFQTACSQSFERQGRPKCGILTRAIKATSTREDLFETLSFGAWWPIWLSLTGEDKVYR